MDDPISHMDDRNSVKILHSCIGGALNGKTRILVTSATNALSYSDYIVVMEMGKIKMVGTYEEVMSDSEYSEITELSIRQERSPGK